MHWRMSIIKKCLNEQGIAKKQEKELPVARYDTKTERAYLENADGTREYE